MRLNPESSGHLAGEVPARGQWWEYSRPFRSFGATGVLDDEEYAHVSGQFDNILETTDGRRGGRYKLQKTRGNYSARILGIRKGLAEVFAPLFSEEWLRSIADFLGLAFVPRIEGALHSNPQGSETGWIHTDLCSGWFDESGGAGEELLFPPRGRCNYFTGKPQVSEAEPREYIRAATLIYYLCNDGWKQGDGGETGLYGAATESDNTEVSLVPPLNNSLLLFECSPHSYHRLVANPGLTRNSIILWLHSEVSVAEEKWGTAINRPGGR